MSRRIDLSRRRDDSNLYAHRDPTPFFVDEDETEELNDEEVNDVGNEEYYEESYDEDVANEEYYENSTQGSRIGIRERVANQIGGVAEEAKGEAKSKLVKLALKNPIVRKVIIIIVAIALVVLLLAILVASVVVQEENKGLATGGYYAMICPEVTVIFVDKNNNYEPIGTETFPLEEYVSGVIRGEVLGLHNIEIYKEMAILARTYIIHRALEHGCTVESSARNQVFRKAEDKPQYAEMVAEAVDATRGQVLLENGEIISAHYDAFCSIAVDDKYYTLKQANQKIPRSWADSQAGIAESWKQGTCAGNHGMGVSQWGSYYLATEEGYKYDEILKFYYGDNVQISTGSFSTLVGLEIKDTSNASTLYEPLSSYLPKKGGSVEDLNNFIKTNVQNNGVGTRGGVVAAAVSLVNYLYDIGGVKLPYYWNGKYQRIGVNPNFGGYTSSSAHGQSNAGFDCSGFVSWAIKNGGFNFPGSGTGGMAQYGYGDTCSISDASCIGQPGDLLNSSNCGSGIGHVQLIVAVDEAKGVYYIAESSYGLTIHSVGIHSNNCGNMHVIHMDNYYNNSANIDYSY